jgi:hypothetical protein
LYADLNNEPDTVITESISEEYLIEWALRSYDHFMSAEDMDRERAINVMKVIEPFKSNWDRTENILDQERKFDD